MLPEQKKVEVTLYDNQLLQTKEFHEFTEDAVHNKGSGCSIHNCTFTHTTLTGPHGDAIQLIPTITGRSNQQYGLAYQENVSVTECIIKAPDTDLQGIFASDGLFYNLVFKNNVVQTKNHGITINGALKITLENNIGKQKFYPARVGGGVYPKKLWVIGFKEDYIKYEPIVSDSPFEDYRTEVFNDTDIFLTNFRYEEYRKAAALIPDGGGNEMAAAFYNLALEYGDIVMGENVVYAQPIEQQRKNKKTRNLLDVLKEELHTREIAGASHNPDVVKYWSATWYKPTNDDEAWCAAFMNWALKEAGLPYTGSPRALDFLNWGIPAKKPEPGCMMIRDYGNGRGHVAVLLGETDTHYQIIGGNQANKVGVDWWPKTGVWHCRRLKKRMMSKTAILTFLEGLGLTGVGGKVANDSLTTSEQSPNGESVEIESAPTPTSTVTTPPSSFEIPEGYLLVPQTTVSTLGVILVVYVVVSIVFKVVIFRDRLKNIFNYGV